jgi:glucose/arabinose dehydrogenase
LTSVVGTALAAAAIAAGCGAADPTTTSGDEQASQQLRLVEIGAFEQPLYVTQPATGDDDHLYVVEQCGRIQRVPIDGAEPTVFLDLSELITCEGEQGLLSIAFSPDYEDSGLFYAYYTDTEGDQRIVEYRRSAGDPALADPGSARELLRMEDFAPNHNGGLVVFGPDGLLYAGTGDGGGGGDPERTSQDPSSLLGKILRIDPRPAGGEPYSTPAGNPFADTPGARGEILVLGLRNPWRYSFDRDTGALWIGDVGQDELEEIDSATQREWADAADPLNFGWSAFEGSRRFNEDQRAPDALGPTLEYGRDGGCSVTGGYVVRDRALDALYGRYLYGDFCEGELRSFTAEPGRPATDDRPLGLTVPSLSSFGEDASGHIYATSLEGAVYRLAVEGSG